MFKTSHTSSYNLRLLVNCPDLNPHVHTFKHSQHHTLICIYSDKRNIFYHQRPDDLENRKTNKIRTNFPFYSDNHFLYVYLTSIPLFIMQMLLYDLSSFLSKKCTLSIWFWVIRHLVNLVYYIIFWKWRNQIRVPLPFQSDFPFKAFIKRNRGSLHFSILTAIASSSCEEFK